MIQRKQTIWLLLAAVCGFAMARVPIFEALLSTNVTQQVMASDSLLLFAVIIGIACLSLISIVLFKNRALQFKLVIIAIILSVAAVALQVWKVEGYKSSVTITKGTYEWGGLLPIAMIIFLVLAARGIYKDEKLVKSLDRLR